MSFNITDIINSNSESFNPAATTFTEVVPAEQPLVEDTVIATADETKKGKGKHGRVFSYAEETKLRINDTTEDALAHYELRTLSGWTGRKWNYIPKYISVYDARRINLEAKKEIVKISPELIDKFPVDKDCRDRLDKLRGSLVPISKALKFGDTYISQLGTEKCRTISKERADKINNYIKKKKIGGGSEIFNLEEIFQKAINEQILEENNLKKISEIIWIKLEDVHREDLRKLSTKIKNFPYFTVSFDSFLRKERNSKISIKNAVLINKLSRKNIFDVTKVSIAKILVSSEKLDELKSLIKNADEGNIHIDQKIRDKVFYLDTIPKKTISLEYAEKINACFGKMIFDVDSLLAQAIQEAEEEAEPFVSAYNSEQGEKKATVTSTSKSKRSSSSDSDIETLEDLEPSSKRRRIIEEQSTGVQNPTPDENTAAMTLAEFHMPAFPQNQPEFSLVGQIMYYFESNLKAPF